jgi:hypothetical protein
VLGRCKDNRTLSSSILRFIPNSPGLNVLVDLVHKEPVFTELMEQMKGDWHLKQGCVGMPSECGPFKTVFARAMACSVRTPLLRTALDSSLQPVFRIPKETSNSFFY